MKPRLSLPPAADIEHVHVREAKAIARDIGYDGDPHMVAFALALIEERNRWNGKSRR